MLIQELRSTIFKEELKSLGVRVGELKRLITALEGRRTSNEERTTNKLRINNVIQFYSRLCLAVLCGYILPPDSEFAEGLHEIHEAGYYSDDAAGLSGDLVRLLYVLTTGSTTMIGKQSDLPRIYEDFLIWRRHLKAGEPFRPFIFRVQIATVT